MKRYIILIATFILVTGFSHHTAYSKTLLPAAYFQLENQDRYVYPPDMTDFSWREIRERREQGKRASRDPKYFRLNILMPEKVFSAAIGPPNHIFPLTEQVFFSHASFFVCDPNGAVKPLSGISSNADEIMIPEDLDLNGRYLLGAYGIISLPEAVDEDSPESLHVSTKYLASHYKNGGKVGSTSVVFFDDENRMPLEIGPVINTAKSRSRGGYQRAHRDYEMLVKYRGAPLPGARVTVTSVESKWQKVFITDEKGIFEIIPADDRSVEADFQNYLYIATHHDKEKKEYHINTFPVTIYKNRPEWRTKTVGFIYWSIIGTGMTVLTVFGYMMRKKRFHNRKLVVFENDRIKRD